MQKKVLALHDISGYGRSSLVPIIAAISAKGHQCVPIPTAIFSTHTAIPGWVTTDLTAAMRPTIEQYDSLGLRFDAIYAGFLGSEEQVDEVLAATKLKNPKSMILIDPVMGDNGLVYETYTPKMCARMRELCGAADIITPNPTEAAILLDKNPSDKPQNAEEVWEWIYALKERYHAKIVLTGIDFEPEKIGSACLEGQDGAICLHRRINRYYPGTGDLFAAVLLGSLLCGNKLQEACREAGEYVADCIEYTEKQQTDPMHGVQFEKLLAKLIP